MEQAARDVNDGIAVECVFHPREKRENQNRFGVRFRDAADFAAFAFYAVLAPSQQHNARETKQHARDENKQRDLEKRSAGKFEDIVPIHDLAPSDGSVLSPRPFCARFAIAMPAPATTPTAAAAPAVTIVGRSNGADCP